MCLSLFVAPVTDADPGPQKRYVKSREMKGHTQGQRPKKEEAGEQGSLVKLWHLSTQTLPEVHLQCWAIGSLRGLPTLQSPKTTGVASSEPASSPLRPPDPQ